MGSSARPEAQQVEDRLVIGADGGFDQRIDRASPFEGEEVALGGKLEDDAFLARRRDDDIRGVLSALANWRRLMVCSEIMVVAPLACGAPTGGSSALLKNV